MVDRESTSRFLQHLRERTQQRRGKRRRRTRTMVAIAMLLTAAVTLALPSIASQLGMGHNLLERRAAEYGLDVTAESMQFGWITPLELRGVQLQGASGQTHATIDAVETGLRLLDLLQSPDHLGQITVRGVEAELVVAEGRSSLEDDLATLLAPDPDAGPAPATTIEVHDVNLTVTDVGSGTAWFAGNIRSTIVLDETQIKVQASSVVTDPAGASGALEVGALIASTTSGDSGADAATWQADLRMRSMPLHIVTLFKRRFPASTETLPTQLGGDASGVISLAQYGDGSFSGDFEAVEIRNLVAADPRLGQRTWTNALGQIDGSLVYDRGVLQAQSLQTATDFGSATLTGTVPLPSRTASLAWVETIRGQGSAEIQLAKLNQAAPGLLPLRSGAEISEGQVTARIESGPSDDGLYRTRCSLRSTPIRGRAAGRPIVLEPVSADATLVLRSGRATAEQVQLRSAFGTATLAGDLRSGTGRFDVDFSRLASMLRPLVELPDAGLRGTARGNIAWSAGPAQQWQLEGQLQAAGLDVSLPGGQSIRQPSLAAAVDARGVWSGETLQQLDHLAASMTSDGHRWQADLVRPVADPASGNPLPLQIRGTGNCAAVAELLRPWMPARLHSIDGSFEGQLTAEVSRTGGRLTSASINLTQPRVAWQEQRFAQPYLKLRFEGACAWPAGDVLANTLTVEGEAVSLAVVGQATAESTELELGWRMDVQRVQAALASAAAKNPVRQVAFVGPPRTRSTAPYQFYGRCEGSATLRGEDGLWSIDTDAAGKNLVVMEATAKNQMVGPVRNPTASGPVWAEPSASVRGVFRYDANTGGAIADAVQVDTPWLSTTVDGHIIWNDLLGEVVLKGPSQLNTSVAAQRLSTLSGQDIRLQGVHSAPLDIILQRRPDGQVTADIRSSIGWDKGSVEGIGFGASTASLVITDTSTTVQPTTVPMDLGQLHLNGRVHYGDDGLWIEQQAGTFAENIQLDPQTARKWLKYLTPLAADATEISGTVSVDLNRCVIAPNDPARSHVSGQMSVQHAELNAGPLADQVIAGIDQLKNLSRGLAAAPPTSRSRRLLSMPAQVVEFELKDAVVTHRRMYFAIDDASLVTSGSVALDGRLNLVAQVPLEASWLGSDVQSLAGETVTLPVSGTLSRPALNTAAIAQTVSSLAIKAGQREAENYLQQQMNRGIDKLFGR